MMERGLQISIFPHKCVIIDMISKLGGGKNEKQTAC